MGSKILGVVAGVATLLTIWVSLILTDGIAIALAGVACLVAGIGIGLPPLMFSKYTEEQFLIARRRIAKGRGK